MANILIVDDEEQIRRLLDRTLLRHGHKCTLAANGLEARKYLAYLLQLSHFRSRMITLFWILRRDA